MRSSVLSERTRLKRYTQSSFALLVVAMFFQLAASIAKAEFVILAAAKDNTLYQSPTGAFSNGAGDFLFSGRTLEAQNSIRRGLIQFNLSSIPTGAVINSVTVRLNMNRAVRAGTVNVGLHQMTRDWGEGTSDATFQGEGTGALATVGDATWTQAINPNVNWTTVGGDFVAQASASLALDPNGLYTWGSTAGLVANVQQWVNNPNSNFGWMILGDESVAAGVTAMRYNSRNNAALGPQLSVDFTAIPEPSSVVLLTLAVGGFFVLRYRQHRSSTVPSTA